MKSNADLYAHRFYGGDDDLLEIAIKMAKELGRTVIVDYHGTLVNITEKDKDFDFEQHSMAMYL